MIEFVLLKFFVGVPTLFSNFNFLITVFIIYINLRVQRYIVKEVLKTTDLISLYTKLPEQPFNVFLIDNLILLLKKNVP